MLCHRLSEFRSSGGKCPFLVRGMCVPRAANGRSSGEERRFNTMLTTFHHRSNDEITAVVINKLRWLLSKRKKPRRFVCLTFGA